MVTKGVVHRTVATLSSPVYREPSAALQAAVSEMGWTVARNDFSLRITQWPLLASEPSYPGSVVLEPQNASPPPDAFGRKPLQNS